MTNSPVTTATQTVCFAAPLLPGTTSLDREEMLSCWHGDRSDEHSASRERLGITREAVWIQPTPAGDLAVVLIEATDLGQAMFGIATSQEPFDVWFRQHLATVHGLDLTQGMTLPELVLDHRR
jgi:hypothetical protein